RRRLLAGGDPRFRRPSGCGDPEDLAHAFRGGGRGAGASVRRERRSGLGGRERPCMRLPPILLLALVVIAAAALLYWKPLHSYMHTREVLNRRQAEVAKLQQQKQQLERRIASVDTGDVLVREARRLGLVKPGEQLYIVRG